MGGGGGGLKYQDTYCMICHFGVCCIQIPKHDVSFNPWLANGVHSDLENGQKQVVAAGREVTKTSLDTFQQPVISTGSH